MRGGGLYITPQVDTTRMIQEVDGHRCYGRFLFFQKPWEAKSLSRVHERQNFKRFIGRSGVETETFTGPLFYLDWKLHQHKVQKN